MDDISTQDDYRLSPVDKPNEILRNSDVKDRQETFGVKVLWKCKLFFNECQRFYFDFGNVCLETNYLVKVSDIIY